MKYFYGDALCLEESRASRGVKKAGGVCVVERRTLQTFISLRYLPFIYHTQLWDTASQVMDLANTAGRNQLRRGTDTHKHSRYTCVQTLL